MRDKIKEVLARVAISSDDKARLEDALVEALEPKRKTKKEDVENDG